MTDTEEVKLVPATEADAGFVAYAMMEAVGLPVMERGEMPDETVIAICRRTDTLYSWQNAVMAKVGDKAAGVLISYPGKGYSETRQHTFSLVPKEWIDFDISKMDSETRDGEYYLDSLAVLPEYRGHGIATLLLQYGIGKAREQHLLPILACDPDNTNAYKLYRKLGFHEDGILFIFGETYLRMVL